MKQYPYWKPVLILLILALAITLILPVRQKLKPGLDLAGGTILLYQVDVPEGMDAQQTVEQTIASLRKRVDPQGVRNLVWRPVAGNRIEIQMAMPSPEAKELRQTYLDRRQAIAQDNLTRGSIASALRLEDADARQAAINNIAGGNASKKEALSKLVELHNELEASRKAYEESNQLLREAREAQSKIPADAAEALAENKAHQQRLLEEFVPVTRRYNQASKAYAEEVEALLASNVEPGELERILSLPAAPTRGKLAVEAATDTNYREPALKAYLERHPDRQEEIQRVVASYNAYDRVKGALDDPNDLIALLQGSGVLEFRIAAQAGQLPEAQVNEYRQQLRDRGPRGDDPYRWFRIDDPSTFAERLSEREAMEEDPETYFRTQRGLVGQRYAGDYYLLLTNQPQNTITSAKPGWEVASAQASADQSGFPAVAFNLNAQGGQYMSQLTGSHEGQPMTIVLDGRVVSVATINDRIGSSGIISGGSGGFSQSELSYLVRTFNAGSLQARLGDYPISIKTIGPGLGQDNLRHGLQATLWALGVILVFMVAYYFLWGLVANIALIFNILLILAAMSLLQATFTLPGIAGIVLTIGMAVDANVLILERIREELENKADLVTAIRLGYEKALSSIVDSNITTMMTSLILYYTATADVKGFGLTLALGIASSMFTALFVTHAITELYIWVVNPKRMSMLTLVVPAVRSVLTPNINWMKYRHVMITFSIITSIACVGIMLSRGSDMLDIQFRSGTQVSFDTKDGKMLSLQEVRDRLTAAAEKHNMPDLAGTRATVVTLGDTETRDGQVFASSFSIATLNESAPDVSNAVKETFSDVVESQRPLTFTGIETDDVSQAPIRPVTSSTLGANIDRPVSTEDITDAVGGVVVVLENLQPAATIKQLSDRIQQVQLQSEYAELGYRPFRVIGLDLANDQAQSQQPAYRSAAIVAWDNSTNYIEDPRSFTTDTQGLAATQWELVKTAMSLDTSLASVSNFSSTVSKTMQQQAIVAMVLSLLAVLIYIWFRFGKIIYGLGAIIALAHDVIMAMGLVALGGYIYDSFFGQALLMTDFKIDLALIAALLTIVGYSLNDTIIIFDRIRENRGRLAYASINVINDSINQTISRTVLTSGTTLVSALSLYILGGDGVHGFAFAMIIGVFVGTYSTIFISSPVLLLMKKPEKLRQEHVAPTAATEEPSTNV